MNKPTVGEASLKLRNQKQESFEPLELAEAMLKGKSYEDSYEYLINSTIKRAKEDEAIHGDFYVVVLFRGERATPNAIRNQYFYTQYCPTPQYDQTVYKHYKHSDELKFLWVVPSKPVCMMMNQIGYIPHTSEMELYKFVKAFMSRELDKICASYNNEPDALIS